MLVGHAGIALVAKRARPRISLPLLVVAAYGCDIVEVLFRAFHQENRELSHSLVSIAIVATAMALGYFVATRRTGDAAVLWLTYALHWPADFLTGTKPTWPGGPEVGLLWYQYPVQEAVFEAIFLGVCIVVAWPVIRRGFGSRV